MTMYVPWLELMIICPLVGALWVRRLRNPDIARRDSLIACGLALLCAGGAWAEFRTVQNIEAHHAWDIGAQVGGQPLLVIDALSAPLLPLTALLFLLTVLATLRTKVRRLSFGSLLIYEAILLATFCCKQPWFIIGLLAIGAVPPAIDLRAHRKPIRIFLFHMVLFIVLLISGQVLLTAGENGDRPSDAAVLLLTAAVLVRSGIVPMHGWMTDLFEHASFATALLFVTPMTGAYVAIRLVLPIAPEWVLHDIAILSLVTALYAAGMALVQREARRFFCYIFLSHSSLVLVGVGSATPMGLTGALCAWLAVSLSMAGFGLTLRSVESRTGPLSLDEFHGLYEHIASLAVLFLLTGLASIGFPGTVGFIGAELLIDGAIRVFPLVGIAIVLVSALNGLAVLYAYFHVFTGTRHLASIDLQLRLPERLSVLILTALILGGGLYPQPGVTSRYEAATQLVEQRENRFAGQPQPSQASRFQNPSRLKAIATDWR